MYELESERADEGGDADEDYTGCYISAFNSGVRVSYMVSAHLLIRRPLYSPFLFTHSILEHAFQA